VDTAHFIHNNKKVPGQMAAMTCGPQG